MSREDPFIVRHSSLPPIGEGQGERGLINRLGMQIVCDFYTQLCLSGMTFHIQAGAEDAGVASSAFATAIDDTLPYLLVDNNAGYGLIPLCYEVNVGVLGAATLAQSMLELDKSKKRYSSAGTAFVPINLNSQASAGSFAGVAYAAGDIVALAKTAVPGSVELARRNWVEDALANTIGYPGAWDPCVYTCRDRPLVMAQGPSSLLGHHASGAATMASYAILQFAQITAAQIDIA